MPAHPKLTEQQWLDVIRRALAGESQRKLAAEYGISPAAIRKRTNENVDKIRSVAGDVIRADAALAALPPGERYIAVCVIDELKAISAFLATAAKLGARTSLELAALANEQVAKVNRTDPMDTQDVLTTIAGLTKMSNEAAAVGLSLLNANRDRMKEPPPDAAEGRTNDDADIFTSRILGLAARSGADGGDGGAVH